jgi:hypothetical protein
MANINFFENMNNYQLLINNGYNMMYIEGYLEMLQNKIENGENYDEFLIHLPITEKRGLYEVAPNVVRESIRRLFPGIENVPLNLDDVDYDIDYNI